METIAIVGGGVAAFNALKQIGISAPNANVTLFSEEGVEAYERPMLSKEMLALPGEIRFVVQAGTRKPGYRILLDTEVTAILPGSRELLTAQGESHPYDKLVIATGSRVRRLPFEGVGAEDVHYLRNLDDARKLRLRLDAGGTMVVIGGGFVGLEVAAMAKSRGLRVVVIEAQPRLLARSAPRSLSRWMQELHESRGVEILLSVDVEGICRGHSGQIEVLTSSGTILADTVVAGIGVVPNTELAVGCGIDVDNGIVVDAHCRTSDRYIWAAGEVTSYPTTASGTRVRTESWTAAADQGTVAGASLFDASGDGYRDLPWLWSDQFDVNVQYLGLPLQAANVSRHGDLRSWVELFWSAEGEMTGAIAVNAGRQMSELRRNARKLLPPPAHYREAAQLEPVG